MVDWCWVRLLSAFKSCRTYSNLGAYNAVNNGFESVMVRKVQNSGKINTFLICCHIYSGQCMYFSKFLSFGGLFFRILLSEVVNNDDVSEICIFLGVEMLEFHVVGELSFWGLQTGINVSNFIPFCYWKGVKFVEKWIHNLHILGKF